MQYLSKFFKLKQQFMDDWTQDWGWNLLLDVCDHKALIILNLLRLQLRTVLRFYIHVFKNVHDINLWLSAV